MFDPALRQEHFLRIYDEQTRTHLYTAMHQMLPLNSASQQQINKPCVLQYLHCRERLTQGVSIEDVLGPELLDLTCLIAPATVQYTHPFTSWIIGYIDAFSPSGGLDWSFRLASIYCVFHLFRWLIVPTAENYARVPDFAKPTPLQLFVAHPLWIDFVIL